MSVIVMVGCDLAKDLFQVHGLEGVGHAVLRKKLRRAHLRELFGQPDNVWPVDYIPTLKVPSLLVLRSRSDHARLDS